MKLLIVGPSSYYTSRALMGLNKKSEDRGYTVVDSSVTCLLEDPRITHIFLVSLVNNAKDTIKVHQGKLTVFLVPQRQAPRSKIVDFWRKERHLISNLCEKVGHEVDFVMSHWIYEYSLAVPRSLTRKLVIVQHDSPLIVSLLAPSVMRLSKVLMAFATRIKHSKANFASVSLETRNRTRWELFLFKEQVLLPNVDTVTVRKLRKIQREKYILYIGNISFLKGAENAIRSFLRLSNEFTEFKLFLVGDGLDVHSRLYRKYGGNPSIIWFGKLSHSDCLDMIERSSLVINTSRHESFGMTCLEALALGTKFISRHPLSSFTEITSGSLLAEVCNTKNFQQRLETLLRKPYSALQQERSREMITRKFGCTAYRETVAKIVGPP